MGKVFLIMKHLICILTLSLLQLKAAEITCTIRETTPLLSKKNGSQRKSNYSEQELQKSFSYCIMRLPQEVGLKIVGTIFNIDDENIIAFNKKNISRAILLQYFYRDKLYNSLKLDAVLGKYIHFDQNAFFQIPDRKLEDDLLNAVEEIKSEYRCCGCLYNMDATKNFVVSEKVYQILENAAQGANLTVDGRKKTPFQYSNRFFTQPGMPIGLILGGLAGAPLLLAPPLQLCGIPFEMGLAYMYGSACGGCACVGASYWIAAEYNGGLREIISIKKSKQN